MIELDIELARNNMLEQQIRPWDVLDQRVLDVIKQVPREHFVPEQYKNLAFSDMQVPINEDQMMMEPKLEARLLQTLQIEPKDRILEIGTGTGYMTACLARLGNEVVTVDIDPELSRQAQQSLAGQGIENVAFQVGDASESWGRDGEFDVIAITGSLPEPPESYKQQLRNNGRLFVIEGDGPLMEAKLITRIGKSDWSIESLFETFLPALVNTGNTDAFVF